MALSPTGGAPALWVQPAPCPWCQNRVHTHQPTRGSRMLRTSEGPFMSVFMNMTLPPTCTRHPDPFLSSPNPMATINLLSVLIVHINGVKQHVGFWSGLFYLPERF